jgi:nucleoside phosphorylase
VICIDYVHYAEFAKYDNGRREPRYFPVQHPDSLLMTSQARAVQVGSSWYNGLMARPSGEDRVPDVTTGELVSVEVVAGDGHAAGQQDLLRGFDHAVAIDMESAGIARAMHTASNTVYYRPVWLGIRGVSDRTAAISTVEALLEANNDERRTWTPYAAAAAARFAHRVVERILKYERSPSADPGAPGWVTVSER